MQARVENGHKEVTIGASVERICSNAHQNARFDLELVRAKVLQNDRLNLNEGRGWVQREAGLDLDKISLDGSNKLIGG